MEWILSVDRTDSGTSSPISNDLAILDDTGTVIVENGMRSLNPDLFDDIFLIIEYSIAA